MNAFSADEFGDVANLLRALGLVDETGEFVGNWVSDPGSYLKTILSDDGQRDALLAFVAATRDGQQETDSAGRVWIEVFSEAIALAGTVRFHLVLDAQPAGEVRLYLGVKFDAGVPETLCRAALLFPLFRVPKPGPDEALDFDLIGTPGGVIELSAEFILSSSPPTAGEAALAGLGILLSVPTDSNGSPNVGLSLTGLQLPGETASRNLVLSLLDPDALEDAAIELILALLQAQLGAAAGAAPELEALARLLGLSQGSGIPALPLEGVLSDGPEALKSWLAEALGSPATRTAWLGALADLLGNGAAATPSGVALPLGAGLPSLDINLTALPGPSGLPIVTLGLGISFADGAVTASLAADLMRIDLGTGAATALPQLKAQILFDIGLSTPDVSVDALALGLALDADRRPVIVLQLRDAQIFSSSYATLDLTDPEAVAAAGAQAVTDALDAVLAQLGPAATLLSVALGLSAPPGATGSYPTGDVIAFLGDPIGTLRAHWQAVLADHTPDMPAVLGVLRELITGAAGAVPGAGTDPDPWLLPLDVTSDLAIALWQPEAGRLCIGTRFRFRVDDLGERCTVIETRMRACLVTLDFVAPAASFLDQIQLTALGRARGGGPLVLSADQLSLQCDHLGLQATWSATTRLRLALDVPNPVMSLDDILLPLDIPPIPARFEDLFDSLTVAQWEAIERIVALVVRDAGPGWLRDLIDAFHWLPDPPALGQTSALRLSLQGLIEDAQAELRGWIARLIRLGGDTAGAGLRVTLQPLARLLSGRPDIGLHLTGAGTLSDPLLVSLDGAANRPQLALWLDPDVPLPPPQTLASLPLRQWRPGSDGLSAASLSAALFSEFPEIDGWLPGGLNAAYVTSQLIAARDLWSGTDGLVAPPASIPAGVTLHLVEDSGCAAILAAHDVATYLGTAAPDTVIVVSTLSETAQIPTLTPAADRVIDLREPGRDPLSYAPLADLPGVVHVLLAPRGDAQLPAGDPDGVAGQAARLAHILATIAGRAGAVVMADAAAGHAAWRALDGMGDGLNKLILVGTPLTASTLPVPASPDVSDMLARLAELLPDPDPSEPDDGALDLARQLLAPRVGCDAVSLIGLALPAGWSPLKRASLEVHAVHGTIAARSIDQALTAIFAAGLSLRAQFRSVQRIAQHIEGAGLGLYLPVTTPATPGALRVRGHILTELLGADLDLDPIPPIAELRANKRVVGHLDLRREGGWLVGGSEAALALRSVEIHGGFAMGAASGPSDRFQLTLFGLRVGPHAFPRLEIDASLSDSDLGVNGRAALTTPEIAQVLSMLMVEIEASGDAMMGHLAGVLRAAGILGTGGSFDPLSLSRWTDNPAARLTEVLNTPALTAELNTAIAGFLGAQTAINFDAAARTLSVTLEGSTGEDMLAEWALSATLSSSGLTAGNLRLGRAAGLNLTATLAPSFAVTLTFDAPVPGVPAVLPIWPMGDVSVVLPSLPPVLFAYVLSRSLEALRHADPSAQPVVEAALVAIGVLNTADPEARVIIPAQAFVDPVGWLSGSSVLGQNGAGGPSFRADRVIALMDALRPLIGVAGSSGHWDILPGLSLGARNAAGLVVEIQLDAAAFQPGSDLAFGGTFGLGFGNGLSPRPQISAHIGLAGGPAGTRAVHVALASGDLQVFLRPGAGGDIGIYPNTGSLADLGALAQAALPAALDAIVDHGGAIGTLLADIGDALDLRSTPPNPAFDGAAISAWASDPAAALAARWPQLIANGLGQLGPLLPGTLAQTNGAGFIEITLSNVPNPGDTLAFRFEATPVRLRLSGTLTGLPFVEQLSMATTLSDVGLERLETTLGPGAVPLGGGIVLRPLVGLDIGPDLASARVISTGLALSDNAADALAVTYSIDSESFNLSYGGATTPADIGAGLMHLAIDLLGAFVVDLPAVDEVLNIGIGTGTLRSVLTNVILTPAGGLDPGVFQVIPLNGQNAQALFDDKLERVFTLIENLAAAGPSVTIDGAVEIGLGRAGDDGLGTTGGILGLRIGLPQRFTLIDGDISLWIENDNRWIIDSPGAGLFIGFLDTGTRDFAPLLRVDGLGLRIGRSNRPLLDQPISLGSIALHVLAQVGGSELLGGAQVQLEGIAVAVGGASGGNPVAQGMLAETNDGEAALAPGFSPALSVQTRPGGGVAFRFRAGDGTGPWWLPIRRQFGPLYVDQIGLGTQEENDRLKTISLLFDGNVKIAGLQAAVDDLELRHDLTAGDGFFDPAAWDVDLAGLAVSADLSGVTLAGALRKFTDPPPPQTPQTFEYIGMLTARFATYGLSIYGGYARAPDFSAFFAFGAVLGPFGGPPAFFLTGIGGGFGINREIVPPTDLGQFNTFPLLAALDPQAPVPSDLMEYLEDVREVFPPAKDQFWFAAGISFTSFALVDGIAVVAVEFGDGFELTIFGLARMALPRPEVALLSIELGLIARFSTSEGVLWIQAQLTDNSWLFHSSARLTGGFAFVSWFDGPNKGQFVLTLGGYHPNFSASGYPVVPRLGWNWSPVSNITIKSETYYALTSEAMMAGGLFEASAKFGPAYAHLSFGGNAIVYFDPFSYEADAHARVSAGIRIKTWFGTIKLSFTLGASIEVSGPEFNGRARVEVGPISVTVRFGGGKIPPPPIGWPEFAAKYLELESGTAARVVSSVAGRGVLVPASATGEEPGTADGSADKPFDVLSEFELSLTTTVPITHIRPGTRAEQDEAVATLGLSPMQRPLEKALLKLTLKRNGTGSEEITNAAEDQIIMTSRRTGFFPKGVWGEAPSSDDRKVPGGRVVRATEGVDFAFRPLALNPIPDASTGGIAFNQVEAGPRKPLPLRPVGALITGLVAEAGSQRASLASFGDTRMPALTDRWLRTPQREVTALQNSDRVRRTPMRVGLLSERIVAAQDRGKKVTIKPGFFGVDRLEFQAPRLRGMMSVPVDTLLEQPRRTSVASFAEELINVPRRAPPRPGATTPLAPLIRAETGAQIASKTLQATNAVPVTATLHSSLGAGAARAGAADRVTLRGVAAMMRQPQSRTDATKARALAPGEIAVFDIPGRDMAAHFKDAGVVTLEGTARVFLIDAYGKVLTDLRPAPKKFTLPKRAAAVVIIAGDSGQTPAEIRGWMAGSRLAYIGRSLGRCAGGFIRAEGASRTRGGRRGGVGWMRASELTDQAPLITTRFDGPAQSVALLIDGIITETELSQMSLAFEGGEADKTQPILVPFDGKTLVVNTVQEAKGPLSVHLGGLTPGRFDGVLASDLDADRLVTRIVNETVQPDLRIAATKGTGPVRFAWVKPDDVEIPTEVLEER
ncbi:DUF6603 domain-containing protein [Roseobacter sp.]|uniref:DUF6603 domain-containing protein n=1 Tax=Roseobacter sp. TaxID=1907202 RepID=UPI00329A6DE5